jgi:hypothetical protein
MLSQLQTILKPIIKQGGFFARHFVDFIGDGWIKASCPQLNISIADTPQNRQLRAYSLVTAPDFYFNVDQGELIVVLTNIGNNIAYTHR